MTPNGTQLLLVRHGECRDIDGRCIGQTDVALSDHGRAEVHRLASHLAGVVAVDRVISSDLSRARHTAEILAAAFGRPLEADARLREMSFGEWDGRTWVDIERSDPARYQRWMAAWLTEAAPGGETVADLLARADNWLASVRGEAKTLMVVSHAGWIRAALTRLLGRDPATMFELAVAHAGVTVVDVTPAGATLAAVNALRVL